MSGGGATLRDMGVSVVVVLGEIGTVGDAESGYVYGMGGE